MRDLVLTILSGVAALGFAVPAQAQAYPGNGDVHHDQDDQLNEQHGDVHDQVNAIHNDAHAQGVNGYEDQRLHQQLNRSHAHADGHLHAAHDSNHQYNGYNNGYYGYSGNNGFYGNNGYPGYNQGYAGYNRAYVNPRYGFRPHHHRHYHHY